jgi:hypothetical protein
MQSTLISAASSGIVPVRAHVCLQFAGRNVAPLTVQAQTALQTAVFTNAPEFINGQLLQVRRITIM